MRNFSKRDLKSTVTGPLLAGLLLVGGAPVVYALPQNGTVAAGSASIATSASEVAVTQSSDRAVVNWSGFDIGAKEKATFKQPSSTSVTLNRVLNSAKASEILGKLQSNGTLMLVNSQGIIFGAGSQVNVGGLVASTADIDDDKFMSGNYVFDKPGNPNALISNAGEITAADGSLVALVGPNVTNTGLIQAKLGKVQMASGDTFTLDLYGDGLLSVQASDKIQSQLVSNSGKVVADGGQILMTAAAAQNAINSVINMDGLLQADSVGSKNGKIVLYAEGSNAVQNNVTADKGTKTGESTVNVSGEISAKGVNAGETGGVVNVLGDVVNIASTAKIDASGSAGGGTILVGGNFKGEGTTPTAKKTTVAAGATLKANALVEGNGGKIAVWADDTTVFSGKAEAKSAGNGDGGYVETSGHTLRVDGTVDVSSVNGVAGTWLLDPANEVIQDDCSGVSGTCTTTASIVSAFANGSAWMVIASDGNVDINSSFNVGYTGSSANSRLMIASNQDITVADGVTISQTGKGLNFKLLADYDSNGTGNITIGKNATISTGSGTITFNAGGLVTLGSGSKLTSTASGDAIVIAGKSFKNEGGSTALSTANGRWLIYAGKYADVVLDGLTNNFRQYNATYGKTTTAKTTGNGVLLQEDYAVSVGLNKSIDKVYDATTVATPDGAFVVTGLSGAEALLANVSYANASYATSHVQTSPITVTVNGVSVNNVKDTSGVSIYGYSLPQSTVYGSGVITPATVAVQANSYAVAYGATVSPLGYGVSGLLGSDTRSVFSGALTYSAAALFGSYPMSTSILQGTLSAGSDYNIVYTPGIITASVPGTATTSEAESNYRPPVTKPITRNSILLAMSNLPRSLLAGLAPAAGGNADVNPETVNLEKAMANLSKLTPMDMASLSPAAGGNGNGMVSVIECTDQTPCQMVQ